MGLAGHIPLWFHNRPKPTIDWSFLGAIPSSLTYARASSGTYFGVDGLLKTAANNEPRFEYDPVTHEPLGLLMEAQATNNALYTKAVSGTVGNTSVSSSYDTVETLDPKGTNEACKTTCGTDTDSHFISATTIGFVNTTAYTLSCFVKAGTITRIQLTGASAVFGTSQYANFGLVGDGSVLASAGCTPRIQQYANGWYRISITLTSVAAATATALAVVFLNSDTAERIRSFAGVGTEVFYVWGFQVEASSFASSVIITTGAAATRAADSLYTTSIPWFNPAQGSMMVDFESSGPSLHIPAEFNDGSYDNRIWFEQNGSNTTVQSSMMSGGVAIGYIGIPRPSIDVTSFKLATSYGTVRDAANNGVLGTRDTTVILPTGIGTLRLGGRGSSYVINGRLRSFKYWNRALPNTELQRITT